MSSSPLLDGERSAELRSRGNGPRVVVGWLVIAAVLAALAAVIKRRLERAIDELVVPRCSEPAVGYLIDLDGTMYMPQGLVEGAQDFFRWLRASGTPYAFLSNTGVKGPLGVQAKFLTPPFRLWEEPVSLRHIHTAAVATAQYLQDNAPNGSRMYVLQGSVSFGHPAKLDSCLRVLRRSARAFGSWQVRTDLSDSEAKQWAAHAGRAPVYVVTCDDGMLMDDAAGDPVTGRKGYTGWDFEVLVRAQWLLQNGGRLVTSAPDARNPFFENGLVLSKLGPGSLHALLLAATYPESADRAIVIGKGGSGGTHYMIDRGIAMLRDQLPPGSPPLDRRRVALVGDTLDTDIKAANLAGIDSVLVTKTGTHTLADLRSYPGVTPGCAVANVGELAMGEGGLG